ncbi:hypothetical protein NESM_000461800 [Novymonas esmeraldas]|uniref:Uncharacterized protein n=1 Tax=Novymonas esmeraldas TaxID=1808958 RepID=A0AAW0EML2_9TRYP
MPGTRQRVGGHRRHGNAPSHERRSASASLPETAVRLAAQFRPRTTRSHLIRRADGRYVEPYSAIVEGDEAVSVLCLQRTPQQVLVRHMPEQEWQRIVREGEEVHPGVAGESSLHIVASSEMSTLPAGVSGRVAPAEPGSPEQPPVFDYFVAPENRIEKMRQTQKSSFFSYLHAQARYPRKELERVAREDRRAMLSVERRNIFLRQYQRDMQHRMAGTPLFTIARELPEEFVQTFFMFEEQFGVTRQRRAATGQRGADRNEDAGGRYLFTIDRSSTFLGERMPFTGQLPADGFVVVTVGPTADAATSAWRPWDPAQRASDEEEEEEPFVPYNYGAAEYVPRARVHEGREGAPAQATEARTSATATLHGEQSAPIEAASSAPLRMANVAAARRRKTGSGGSSRASSLSESTPSCSPLLATSRRRTASAERGGRVLLGDTRRPHTHSSTALPLSSDDDGDDGADDSVPPRVSPCVVVR